MKDSIKLFRNFLKRLVFEKGDSKWTDVIATTIKQYNNRVQTSTKLTPKQASLKKNEVYVDKIFFDKRKKVQPKFQVNDLVRVADLKRIFSKGYTTNWSYKIDKITEVIIDTIPSYKIDQLSERYNEALL